MRIVSHDRFQTIIDKEVTSIVILDDNDNPIAVAIRHQPGHIQVAHLLDEDFNSLLSQMGYKLNTPVKTYNPPPNNDVSHYPIKT